MDNNTSVFTEDKWSFKGGGKVLLYSGEPLKDNLDLTAVREWVHKMSALGAMWAYDYGYNKEGPWYRTICDTTGYDIDKIGSKNSRHNIRRGLKNCAVRRIDYPWLGDNGYETYINATSRYANFVPVSREAFKKTMSEHYGVSGREAFGVFVGEKLAGYATILVFGQRVHVYAGKFDPAYSQTYPMWALLYTITNHYLSKSGFKEVDGGFRALLHETNIGDSLLRLGWRREYCRLGVYFRPSVRTALGVARVFRKLCKLILPTRHYAILESILLAQEIAKATEK